MTTFRTVFNRWGSVKKKLYLLIGKRNTHIPPNGKVQKIIIFKRFSSCKGIRVMPSSQEVVVSHANVVTFRGLVCDISIKSMRHPDHSG